MQICLIKYPLQVAE